MHILLWCLVIGVSVMMFLRIRETIIYERDLKNMKKTVKIDDNKTIFDVYLEEKYQDRVNLSDKELCELKWYIIDKMMEKDPTLYDILYDRFFKSEDSGINFINSYFLILKDLK